MSLMGYNLLAMFGLDKKIGAIAKSFTEWWTTPPTAEELAEFEEGMKPQGEDDDVKQAEKEEG